MLAWKWNIKDILRGGMRMRIILSLNTELNFVASGNIWSLGDYEEEERDIGEIKHMNLWC